VVRKFSREFIAFAGSAIANRLIEFTRSQIFPNTHVAQRCKHSIVERGRALDIGDAE
jgi:hypothetical protein